jgi:hypothetical protein
MVLTRLPRSGRVVHGWLSLWAKGEEPPHLQRRASDGGCRRWRPPQPAPSHAGAAAPRQGAPQLGGRTGSAACLSSPRPHGGRHSCATCQGHGSVVQRLCCAERGQRSELSLCHVCVGRERDWGPGPRGGGFGGGDGTGRGRGGRYRRPLSSLLACAVPTSILRLGTAPPPPTSCRGGTALNTRAQSRGAPHRACILGACGRILHAAGALPTLLHQHVLQHGGQGGGSSAAARMQFVV